MQEPTHILTGVLIQKTLAPVKPRALGLVVVAGLAFLSHGFLDELSRVTFHPADPDFHSVFWVTYHLGVLAGTILCLCLWWRQYKWGIFFAALPDLDWVFIHGQNVLHVPGAFYKRPYLHESLGYIYHHVPPFSWVTAQIGRLPNYRHNPWACLWEIALIGGLLLVLRLLQMGRRTRSAPSQN